VNEPFVPWPCMPALPSTLAFTCTTKLLSTLCFNSVLLCVPPLKRIQKLHKRRHFVATFCGLKLSNLFILFGLRFYKFHIIILNISSLLPHFLRARKPLHQQGKALQCLGFHCPSFKIIAAKIYITHSSKFTKNFGKMQKGRPYNYP